MLAARFLRRFVISESSLAMPAMRPIRPKSATSLGIWRLSRAFASSGGIVDPGAETTIVPLYVVSKKATITLKGDLMTTLANHAIESEIQLRSPQLGLMMNLLGKSQPESEGDVVLRLLWLLHAFQESTVDGILIVDEDRQVLGYNQRFQELWQIPDRIIRSGDDNGILSYATTLMREPEEFLARVMDLYANPLERSYEEVPLKDNRVFERYSAPILSERDEVLGRIWYFRDVTYRWKAAAELQAEIVERQRAEIELQRILAQSEQIIAAISSILITIDENGSIVTWNGAAEAAFGRSTAEMLETSFASCGIDWDWNTVNAAIETCLAEQRSIRIDNVRYVGSRGEDRVLGVSVCPIDRYCDSPKGFLLLGADVTERRAMEEQLAHAQKMESIGQLAAGIAHEINTPIQYTGDNLRFLQEAMSALRPLLTSYHEFVRTVRGRSSDPAAELAVEEAEREADLDYLLQEIPCAITQSLEGIDRVSHIVRAMKDFSHPGTANRIATDINRALASTITITSNEWKYVAEVVTEFDPDLPPVWCFPADINQVFLNLLVNAAHAIGDVVGDGSCGKGTITVRTRRATNHIEVEISDTGTGMTDDVKQKIFDPFFTTKEVGRGTGQGLAISHNVIVEKHQGAIAVQTALGQGTTFRICLPLAEPGSGARQ